MANFSQMDNSFAQQYLAQNSTSNDRYNQIKSYVASLTGGEFIMERATAFVGTDPNIKGSSYVLVIEPTFKTFKDGDRSHIAGSMVSYFSEGKAAFVGSTAVIGHNPYLIQTLSLVEMNTDGTITATPVSREALQSQTVEEVAAQLSQIDYNPENFTPISTQLSPTDLAAIANIAMGQFTSDSYASVLYSPEALNSLLNDSSIPAVFTQAAALKKAANNSTITVVLCSSTSCNGCSSSSSTISLF